MIKLNLCCRVHLLGGIFFQAQQNKSLKTPLLNCNNKDKASLHEHFDKIKRGFLQAHARHALNQLQPIEHIIIYIDGILFLWGQEKKGHYIEINRAETAAKKEDYRLILSISHLSVWLTLHFQSKIMGTNPQELEDDEFRLKQYLTDLKNLNSEHIKKHHYFLEILTLKLIQLQQCKSQEEVIDLYHSYLSQIKTTNQFYAKEATDLQLKALHNVIRHWSDKHKILWENSRTILVGTRGPRKDLVEKQYFKKWYAEQGIGHAEKDKGMVLYAEMLPEQIASIKMDDLIKFLAAQEGNRLIGYSMLGDKNAMNKDVLGKYAPKLLGQLSFWKANNKDPKGITMQTCPFADKRM